MLESCLNLIVSRSTSVSLSVVSMLSKLSLFELILVCTLVRSLLSFFYTSWYITRVLFLASLCQIMHSNSIKLIP